MAHNTRWRLEGYDTFASEWYPLEGDDTTEALAIEAAKQRLRELEQSQPTSQSGGQAGIQDHVFVVAPDGTRRRIFPIMQGKGFSDGTITTEVVTHRRLLLIWLR